jgi:Bacterial pre-peptidase C-terminal domain
VSVQRISGGIVNEHRPRTAFSHCFQRAAARRGAIAFLVLLSGVAMARAASPTLSPETGPRKVGGNLRLQRTFACVTQGIPCNTTMSGTLTSDDCVLEADGSNYDPWTFQATAGQTVRITMHAGFDAYLLLLDPRGNFLEENNNYPGGGSDSRISWDIDETGTYTIYANSFAPGATGPYTLELVCNTADCTSNSTTLCLNGGRFRVSAIFSAPNLGITNAAAQVVRLTGDTGYFWFFSANNVELVLKVVDGRAFNNFFWVFYGALSDVEYTITVTDTATSRVKTYHNTPGHLASVADTAAFSGTGTAAVGESAAASRPVIDDLVRAESGQIVSLLSASSPTACTVDATTLCLNGGRFQVRAVFTAPTLGLTNAPAQAVPLTGDTGYFWFFSANNVEIVLKAVDGRAFNGFFWVFYGALSDVQYTITVTDTVTGAVKTYANAQGNLASVADTAAFH